MSLFMAGVAVNQALLLPVPALVTFNFIAAVSILGYSIRITNSIALQ